MHSAPQLITIDNPEPLTQRIVALFNQHFIGAHNTELIMGASEPLYLPSTATAPRNRIYFSYDYPASALHEIAHFCQAGPRRRQLPDYGYWYEADGRSSAQQLQFEQVEVKPQAIELCLALSCGHRFRPSSDNLNASMAASNEFIRAIKAQAYTYISQRQLPRDALIFSDILCRAFNRELNLAALAECNLA